MLGSYGATSEVCSFKVGTVCPYKICTGHTRCILYLSLCKINKDSYIFRTKIINQYQGFVNFVTDKSDLFEQKIQIITNNYNLINSRLQKLPIETLIHKYVLNYRNLKFSLNLEVKNNKLYLNTKYSQQFGSLLSTNFQTEMGGTPYYDLFIKYKFFNLSSKVAYIIVL